MTTVSGESKGPKNTKRLWTHRGVVARVFPQMKTASRTSSVFDGSRRSTASCEPGMWSVRQRYWTLQSPGISQQSPPTSIPGLLQSARVGPGLLQSARVGPAYETCLCKQFLWIMWLQHTFTLSISPLYLRGKTEQVQALFHLEHCSL